MLMVGEQEREDEEEDLDKNNNNNNRDNKKNKKKAPRLPRWTRQEILVLIEGKRVAESRRVMSRRVLDPPKWASVSSYCKSHGVNRGPVQCRKRWSNLSGDYKKIKDWEEDSNNHSDDSFWLMRNDLRRYRRLPGFFDKQVYDILDNAPPPTGTTLVHLDHTSTLPPPAAAASTTNVGLILALGRCSTTTHTHDAVVATEEDEEEEENEEDEEAVFFDSGPTRTTTAEEEEEEMFSDSEKEPTLPSDHQHKSPHQISSPLPISEQQQYSPLHKGHSSKGTNVGKEDGFFNPEVGDTSGEGRKRKRSSAEDRNDDEETNVLQHQLISVLEKNGQMLNTHLQSQNTNSQMDREQRKDHVDSLVAVLGKLADALGRIADKL